MNVPRREPGTASRPADGPSPPRTDGDAPAAMRASQEEKNEDPPAEDVIDEPGYGHGV